MSWRNNISGSKTSHLVCVIWNSLLCSISPRYEWVSVWLILLLPRILLLYRYSCQGLASSAVWKWMFSFISFFKFAQKNVVHSFYVSALSNYFNEPQHWLDVLPSVLMEKHLWKILQTSCVFGFDIIYILKLPPSRAHHLKASSHVHNLILS